MVDSGSTIAHWATSGEFNVSTFQRFALPISWDFSEVNFLSGLTGSYPNALDWVALASAHFLSAAETATSPAVILGSAMESKMSAGYDAIVTDPPYYDAIPYSDLMDFFYVWLRRCASGLSRDHDRAFTSPLGPKWDEARGDGELIDDCTRHGGDAAKSEASL